VNLTFHLHGMPRLRNIVAMSFLICVSCTHTENFMFNRDITSNAGKVKKQVSQYTYERNICELSRDHYSCGNAVSMYILSMCMWS